LARITAQKAADIMDKYVVCARKEDDLKTVLERMIDNHIKEIPVVDEDKKIIANIGIIDLWKLIEKGGF
jgi:CBS domain-containing protein